MDIVTSHNGMKAILELDESEIKWWRKKIAEVRSLYIKAPKELISQYIQSKIDNPDYRESVRNTSEFIKDVRKNTWDKYIDSELQFYKSVISVLIKERAYPHDILTSVLTPNNIRDIKDSKNNKETMQLITNIFGEFSGRIFPYFYELSKSVTNSRRSRAGKAFEEIIHSIMRAYNYPYCDQSKLGKKTFEKEGLGKIVDGILPNIDSYSINRSKCLIITMKTTLRERWQEVVEELNRTNVPSIHLLTLDEGINTNLLTRTMDKLSSNKH